MCPEELSPASGSPAIRQNSLIPYRTWQLSSEECLAREGGWAAVCNQPFPLQVDLSAGHLSAVLCSMGGMSTLAHGLLLAVPCDKYERAAWQLVTVTRCSGEQHSLLEAEGRGGTCRGREHATWHSPQVLLTVDRDVLLICESKPLLAEHQLADHSLYCYAGPERHD